METTLGKRIVQNRKRLGLTQDQLADKLGVTAQAVSKWENDQSCPDITMLPRLAEIFGVSTDALLGHQAPPPVREAEVVTEETSDVHTHVGNWEFKFDSGRRSALCYGLTVLTVGVVYLLSAVFDLGASFWEILWPTIPLIFGLFGLYPRFSFLRMGCALVGGYFLLSNLQLIPFGFDGELIFPLLVILFGVSLLADAFKKPRKSKLQVKGNSSKRKEQLHTDDNSFEYSASFGESTQYIQMPCLHTGSISISFGDYTLDLSGAASVAEDCSLDVNCAFGELTLLVPARYIVRPTTSTAFGEISVHGTPDAQAQGVIHLNASASFGEITVRYI